MTLIRTTHHSQSKLPFMSVEILLHGQSAFLRQKAQCFRQKWLRTMTGSISLFHHCLHISSHHHSISSHQFTVLSINVSAATRLKPEPDFLRQSRHRPPPIGHHLKQKTFSSQLFFFFFPVKILSCFGGIWLSEDKMAPTSRVNYCPRGALSWTSLFLMDSLVHCLCYVEDSSTVQSQKKRDKEKEWGTGGDTWTLNQIPVITMISKQPSRFGANHNPLYFLVE